MREKVNSFGTNDTMINYFSELGFNDVEFPHAYGENNIYVMLHRKFFPIQECETSTLKNEYEYLDKKDKEIKRYN